MTVVWVFEKIEKWDQSLLSCLAPVVTIRLFENIKYFHDLSLSEKNFRDTQVDGVIVDQDSIAIEDSDFKVIEKKLKCVKVMLSKNYETMELKKLCGNIHRVNRYIDKKDLLIFLNKIILKGGLKNEDLSYSDLIFNFEQKQLRFPPGEEEHLSYKEARLLKLFMESPHKCWNRLELQEIVWNGLKVSPRTIDSHISRLRKKLRNTNTTIENRYGGGYIFS